MRKPVLHAKKEGGQAIVLIAIAMVILLASLGLAIDGGGLYLLYRDAQNAVDSAALTAAYTLCTEGDAEAQTYRSLALNGFDNAADGINVTVTQGPAEYGNNDNYVLIELNAEKPSYFIQVVYPAPLYVNVEAVALCRPSSDFGWPENSSVISLSPTCAAFGGSSQPPFKTVGNADYETQGGGIYINGDASSCDGADERGSAEVIAGGYGVCGHNTIDSGIETPEGSIDEDCPDGPITGSNPLYPDPFVDGGLTAPDCASLPLRTLDGSGNNIETVTPNLGDPGYNLPGRYTSFDVGTNDEVFLSTGIYCIDETGGSNEVKWQGVVVSDEPEGVMLYLYGSTNSLDSTSNATVRLYALTDDDSDYENLLLWDDSAALPSNSRAISLAGQSNFELEGTVYAPRAHCSIAGGSAPNLIYGQFICYSSDFAGGSGITIIYDPSRVFQIPGEFGVDR